jgi:hypothetical protein
LDIQAVECANTSRNADEVSDGIGCAEATPWRDIPAHFQHRGCGVQEKQGFLIKGSNL